MQNVIRIRREVAVWIVRGGPDHTWGEFLMKEHFEVDLEASAGPRQMLGSGVYKERCILSKRNQVRKDTQSGCCEDALKE